MNPLLAKEIRLLLPTFAMALLLAVAPVWLLRNFSEAAAITVYLYGFGVAILALCSFGREFGLKTFPVMLAQPLSRRRLWWTKVAVLGCAMAATYGAWFLSCQAFGEVGFGNSLRETLTVAGLISLVTFAGGLWTTMLLRQVAAAFWLTILIPLAILAAIGQIGGGLRVDAAALVLYSVAGFWWAWRQFLRAQETAWTGGVITFSKPQSVGAGSRSLGRARRPISALMAKELQMHHVVLAGMGGLFLLHLAVLAVRKAGHNALGDLTRAGLESFWLLWFPVPLLAGCASVAEERKLGTMQGMMCEPISGRVQYAVKLLFVVVLGGLVSGLLLWVAEGIGAKVGAVSYKSEFSTPFDPETLAMVFFLFVAISLIGFYASTLARNLMQALGIAVVTAIAFALPLVLLSNLRTVFGISAWQWGLVNYIEWPTLVGALLWLAYGNFRRFSENWHLWLRNLLGLAAALVLIPTLAACLYHRVWEFLTPLEPPHGPARLAGGKAPALHIASGVGVAVVLPNGRLWVDRIIHEPGRRVMKFGPSTWISLGGKWIGEPGNHFLDGSNWVDAVADFRETVGIRSDGSLWVSDEPRQPFVRAGDGELRVAEPAGLARFGGETNWLSAVRDFQSQSMLLLKTDGTLWRWGTNGWLKNWPGLRLCEPHKLRFASGWAEMLSAGVSIYAWRTNGQAWLLNSAVRGPWTTIERRENLDGSKWRSLTESGPFQAGVREDGTLWIWLSPSGSGNRVPEVGKEQIGKSTGWAAVALSHSKLVALKADGSLWRWDFIYWQTPQGWMLPESPVRLGIHNDCVALNSLWDGFVSLAADGSLWFWAARESSDDQPLLRVSRRPEKIAELFGKGD